MQLSDLLTVLSRRPGYVSSALRIGCISAISVEAGGAVHPLAGPGYRTQCIRDGTASAGPPPLPRLSPADWTSFTDANVIFACRAGFPAWMRQPCCPNDHGVTPTPAGATRAWGRGRPGPRGPGDEAGRGHERPGDEAGRATRGQGTRPAGWTGPGPPDPRDAAGGVHGTRARRPPGTPALTQQDHQHAAF